jgi:two-component system, NarL family, response regulator LiaR
MNFQAQTMTDPIRVLIADDHALFRQGLQALLHTISSILIVGDAADGLEAVEMTHRLKPDVILMDLEMPRKDGITAIREIKLADPGARILVLTSFEDEERVFSAIQAGALGYMLKDSTAEELTHAITDVYHNKPSLPPLLALKVIREMNHPPTSALPSSPLTTREKEVLDRVAQGLSNQGIAQELIITERTVGKHVSNILGKLHLENRTQAALYLRQSGVMYNHK